jgi:hypothetical protein
VQDAFGTVLIIVVALGVVVAAFTFAGTNKAYDEIGRGGLSLREDGDDRPAPSPAGGRAERDAEILQMLNARNARLQRRGERPLDVDEELARLTAPVVDDELRGEIRAHVIASNERRERRGEPALDIDSEVERQVRELS